MMRTILIFLILALLAPAASAADVTAVPAGVSTEAVKAFRRGLEHRVAIQLRPTFPQAHDYLARAYLATGDNAAALREYDIARRLDSMLAHCLKEAIARNDPDYNDMAWNASSSGVASSSAA